MELVAQWSLQSSLSENVHNLLYFFQQKSDLKLGGHYTCQMIEIVYKGFTIIKKTKWARQQLHSIVCLCAERGGANIDFVYT